MTLALLATSVACRGGDQDPSVLDRRPAPRSGTAPAGGGGDAADGGCPGVPTAGAPGTLPADGPATVAGLDLPIGHVVREEAAPGPGSTTSEPLVHTAATAVPPPGSSRSTRPTTRPRPTIAPRPADGPPVLWITDDVLPDAPTRWVTLARAFPRTGLWPLLVTSPDGTPWWDESLRPDGTPPAIDAARAGALLDAGWDLTLHPEDPATVDPDVLDAVAPFDDTFPGLADPVAVDRCDTDLWGTVADLDEPARVALVAVTRPADAVAAMHWQGPVNYDIDPADLASVLRSWEDRFGAITVELDVDQITLVPQRQPTGRDQLQRVAAEHLAIAPDTVLQDTGTLAAYERDLRAYGVWDLWWD